jgi:hypothetical protein
MTAVDVILELELLNYLDLEVSFFWNTETQLIVARISHTLSQAADGNSWCTRPRACWAWHAMYLGSPIGGWTDGHTRTISYRFRRDLMGFKMISIANMCGFLLWDDHTPYTIWWSWYIWTRRVFCFRECNYVKHGSDCDRHNLYNFFWLNINTNKSYWNAERLGRKLFQNPKQERKWWFG